MKCTYGELDDVTCPTPAAKRVTLMHRVYDVCDAHAQTLQRYRDKWWPLQPIEVETL